MIEYEHYYLYIEDSIIFLSPKRKTLLGLTDKDEIIKDVSDIELSSIQFHPTNPFILCINNIGMMKSDIYLKGNHLITIYNPYLRWYNDDYLFYVDKLRNMIRVIDMNDKEVYHIDNIVGDAKYAFESDKNTYLVVEKESHLYLQKCSSSSKHSKSCHAKLLSRSRISEESITYIHPYLMIDYETRILIS
jgi:hypothetical protein